MTDNGKDTIADAANIIATDDAESSTETIIERSEAGAASGDGGGDDVQDHEPDGTVPFARSRHPEQSEKPSKHRRGRKHRRLYPQKLLHSGRSTVGLSVCDDDESRSAI